jgi:hypothetical protein
MAGKRRSRLKLKSAIFWILIIVIVLVYRLLEISGIDGETDFIGLIDRFSGYAFEVFMWLLLALIIFILARFILRLFR